MANVMQGGPILIALYVLLQSPVVEDKDERDNLWSGFKEGSSSRYRVTVRFGKEVSRTREGSRVLKKVLKDKLVVFFDEALGEARGVELPCGSIVMGSGNQPAITRRVGKEKCAVGSIEYECDILETVQGPCTTKVWKSSVAPGKVVKEETSYKEGAVIRGRLIAVDESIPIENEKVACWVFESELKEPDGAVVHTKSWLSKAVPGGEVRKIIRTSRGVDKGDESMIMTTEYELLKYEKK